MPSKKPFSYLAAQKPRDGRPAADFAVGDSRFVKTVLAEWRNPDGAQEAKKIALDPTPEPPDFTHDSALTDALQRAVDFGLSQYELIMVASITPSLFGGIIARERVLRPVTDSAILVEEDDVAALYELTEDEYYELMRQRENLNQLNAGVAALPKATLMSIVATFDTIVVDIVRKMLRLGSSEWLEKSDKTLPFKSLASGPTIDDLIDEAIRDEVYLFSRGSHDDQERFIQRTFGVSIKERWKRWPDYIEVFERRNLIAHGETKFNRRYVEICTSAGHKGSSKLEGDEVELNPRYLNQACDVLMEFALLLPFTLWRKLSKENERDAFLNLNEAAYKLIRNQRYVPAERILDFALGLDKTNLDQDMRQRMIVNLASAIRHSGDADRAKRALEKQDWSGASDLFKMCVAAIFSDAEEVNRLIPLVKGAAAISAREFKEWPCLTFVRDDESVRKTFQKSFGEPLAPSKISNAVEDTASSQTSTEEETVH